MESDMNLHIVYSANVHSNFYFILLIAIIYLYKYKIIFTLSIKNLDYCIIEISATGVSDIFFSNKMQV